jgi:hypothetical protein
MYLYLGPIFHLLVARRRANECGVRKVTMNSNSYILFNKSREQVRLLGARGGRTFARNQRVRRRALVATPQPPMPSLPAIRIPMAESIAMLDARFPWLRGVEKRGS